jgi:hypothetical protein
VSDPNDLGTGPVGSAASRDAEPREYQTVGALHFGSFEGWPENRVQAHIDGRGLFAPHPVLMGVATASLGFLLQMLAHGVTKNTFADPYTIRGALLDEGFDPATLMGTDPKNPGPSNVR